MDFQSIVFWFSLSYVVWIYGNRALALLVRSFVKFHGQFCDSLFIVPAYYAFVFLLFGHVVVFVLPRFYENTLLIFIA